MSQKFDEGGAKGLLLVNLSVANDGCRIVLDSKELKDGDDAGDEDENEEGSDEVLDANENGEKAIDANESRSNDIDDKQMPREEGMVDITCLTRKLRDFLSLKPLDSYDIAPQLEDLRKSYDVLEEEGYVDAGKALKPKVSRMSCATGCCSCTI